MTDLHSSVLKWCSAHTLLRCRMHSGVPNHVIPNSYATLFGRRMAPSKLAQELVTHFPAEKGKMKLPSCIQYFLVLPIQ